MKAWTQILLLAAVTGGFLLWQHHERRNADEAAWCHGLPVSSTGGIRNAALVLRNHGFSVGYSDVLANPLWVAYRLFPPLYPPPEDRPEAGFRRDDRSLRGVEPAAFSGTGYQRGHLAPNYAMYRVHGAASQQDSFLMTNISPQRPRLNQKAWQRIEEVVMDHLLPGNGPLCVITGPVFGDSPHILPSGVTVPEAFYKILVTREPTPRALALVVPQDVTGYEPLDRFLVTVDDIEARTGLDFLHALPDEKENSIERALAHGWGLEAVARNPPRY